MSLSIFGSGNPENLTFTAYEDKDFSTTVGSYVAATNPNSVSTSYNLSSGNNADKVKKEPGQSDGNPINDSTLVAPRVTISFKFMIDGSLKVASSLPPIVASLLGSSDPAGIAEDIKKLKKATIDPVRDSHQSPFTEISWGSMNYRGKVTSLEITYKLFNGSGEPMRAEVSLSLTTLSSSDPQNRSPDITRIPLIKDGDSLAALCDEFYHNAELMIRVAEFNKLPTFRRIEIGSQIEFPPIEK